MSWVQSVFLERTNCYYLGTAYKDKINVSENILSNPAGQNITFSSEDLPVSSPHLHWEDTEKKKGGGDKWGMNQEDR